MKLAMNSTNGMMAMSGLLRLVSTITRMATRRTAAVTTVRTSQQPDLLALQFLGEVLFQFFFRFGLQVPVEFQR